MTNLDFMLLMSLALAENIMDKKLQVSTTFFAHITGCESTTTYRRTRLNGLAKDGFLDKKRIRNKCIYSLTDSSRYMLNSFMTQAMRSASDLERQLYLWEQIDEIRARKEEHAS